MSLLHESTQTERKVRQTVNGTSTVCVNGTTSSDKQRCDGRCESITNNCKEEVQKSCLAEQETEKENKSIYKSTSKNGSRLSHNNSQNSTASNLSKIDASSSPTYNIVNIDNNDILKVSVEKPFYFTFEYYIYLITLISYLSYATWCVYKSSVSQLYVFRYNVAGPMHFLGKYFNAKYYDELLDSQWRGFTRNLPTFIKLFTFLACMTWVIRRWFIPYLEHFIEKESPEKKLSSLQEEKLQLPKPIQQNLESEINIVSSPLSDDSELHSRETRNLLITDESSINNNTIGNSRFADIYTTMHKWFNTVSVKIVSQWSRWHHKLKCLKHQQGVDNENASLLVRITNFYGITWPLCTLYIIVGLAFMVIVHGPYFVFPLMFIFINYIFAHSMQHRLPFSLYMSVVWLANLLFLYAGMKYNSFNSVELFKPLFMKTMKTNYFVNGKEFVKVTQQMRWHQRMRWQSTQGLTMLRIVAFHYDKWEACHLTPVAQRVCELVRRKHDQTCIECAKLRNNKKKDGSNNKTWKELFYCKNSSNTEKGKEDEIEEKVNKCKDANSITVTNIKPSNHLENNNNMDSRCKIKECVLFHSEIDYRERCYKFRAAYPLPTTEYNLMHYLAFMLFTPLYVSGPISTFNAFVSYMYSPTSSFPIRTMLLYTFRTLMLFVLNSIMLHYLYVVALTYSAGVLTSLPTCHQACILYFYLGFLWMKFGFIWKSARLFAAWCGVEVPEDMRRCFSSTVSIQEFWRDWHASFNLWIVRYMYIPMGGNKTKFISIFPIFMFIAFWHDLELRLIHWALCICAAFLLELVCSAMIKCMVQSVRNEMYDITSSRKVNNNCEDENAKQANNEGKTSSLPLEHTHHTSTCKYKKIWTCVHRYATHYCKSFMRFYHFLIHIYAMFILSHLSHSQRVWLFRFARSWAAAINAFLLIIANLIGFSVQHAGTSYNLESKPPSQTEHTIAHGLAQTSWWLRCGIIISLFCAASISIMHRDAEINKQQRQRLKYHLQK